MHLTPHSLLICGDHDTYASQMVWSDIHSMLCSVSHYELFGQTQDCIIHIFQRGSLCISMFLSSQET